METIWALTALDLEIGAHTGVPKTQLVRDPQNAEHSYLTKILL
jgi:hypothetical protein